MSNKNFTDKLNLGKDKKNSFQFGFENLPDISTDGIIEMLDLDCLVDAPDEWNFYKPLSDDKIAELIESIERNGLLNPLIVWEQDNSKYMILSGHNRKRAFEFLREISTDDRYNKIPAIIKKKSNLTEDDAREIIIDTNWVQRVLSPIEKAKSIIEKYAVLQSKSNYASGFNKYGEGALRDVVAKEYKISGRQVERYRNLDNLIVEIQDLVVKNIIPLTPCLDIAKVNKDIQKWIFENYKDKINAKYTRKLKVGMTIDAVKDIFEESRPLEKFNFIKVKTPMSLYDKYNALSIAHKIKLENEFLNLLRKYEE